MAQSVLCYVDGDAAYFADIAPTEIWGDDWNDAPYEHNAGAPYKWMPYMLEKYGKEPYTVRQVRFYGPLLRPCDGFLNSPHSVEDINRPQSHIPWVRSGEHAKAVVRIYAGTPIAEFCQLVRDAGGVAEEIAE